MSGLPVSEGADSINIAFNIRKSFDTSYLIRENKLFIFKEDFIYEN